MATATYTAVSEHSSSNVSGGAGGLNSFMKTELFLKEKELQPRFKSRKSMVVVLRIYTGKEYQTSGVWY